jgi:ribosomal protein S18 acetylase RimI-like enzyme
MRISGHQESPAHKIVPHVAKSADLETILKFVRAYYRFDGIPYRHRKIRTALRMLLKGPWLGRVWIIRDGKNAVGHAILTFGYDLEFGGRQATITELFIAAEYRSRGLGRKMIKVIEGTCRQLGIGAIELQVERDNVRAQSVYRKLGFRGYDRIPMSKVLLLGGSRVRPSQSLQKRAR